ncbi:MAG: PSD1 and planctomycete cytochrome C domain-containing protein [Pirellulales bacterium]
MATVPLGRIRLVILFLVAWAIASSGLGRAHALDDVGGVPQFERDVKPLLERYCSHCHGERNHKAELSVVSLAGLRKGGESGPVLAAGKPAESPLFELVSTGHMPPAGEKRPTAAEVETLRRWIEQGYRSEDPANDAEKIAFHEVLPILLLRCASCHGRQTQEAGLDVRSFESLMKGGKSGPAIRPGDASASPLLQRIAAGEMPPKAKLAAASVKPVEKGEYDKLQRWIEQGAAHPSPTIDVPNGEPDPLVSDADRQFWSFQPPAHPTIPLSFDDDAHAARRAASRTPVDVFLDAELRKSDLRLQADADRAVLARRLTVDLLGVPPSVELVDEFVADDGPDAYERLVDRLLASPRYGERWAQFWLDLGGYSDSEGVQDSDLPRPWVYRYRDYVIRAWNADKTYDRFLLEQLAGDELADYEHAPQITAELSDNLVATAFLRLTADGTFAGITGFVPDRLDMIDDQLRIVGGSVLGLTIGCARCHSHKFDPFPQRDYYRMAAVFKGALDEHDWLKPTRQGGPPGTHDRYLPYAPAEERAGWEAHERQIQAQVDDLRRQLAAAGDDAEAKKRLEAEIKKAESQRRPEPLVRALWDRGDPSPTYILTRGNYLTPGRLVGPAFPSMLTDGRTPLVASPPWPNAQKTGLRLAFARWLATPDHPLTSRVFVNRLWKHHFGEGLVRTLDNFGRAGDPPSHPELLDWLARRFTHDAWSVKSFQRLVVTSSAFRQSSYLTQAALDRDPENRRLSRFPLKRLEAEAVYDSLLSLADLLDHRPYGPPDEFTARPDGLVTANATHGGYRRAIYVRHRRTQPVSLLADFDRPAMSPNCVARVDSTVAPQALYLLNNAQLQSWAESFAERAMQEAPDRSDLDPAVVAQQRLERLMRLAWSRTPSGEEREAFRTAYTELLATWRTRLAALEKTPEKAPAMLELETQRRALAQTAHALMNSAGFLFVE